MFDHLTRYLKFSIHIVHPSSARRIRVDTSVLTSTPYKKYLEEEANKRIDIEQKKSLKERKKFKKTVTNKQNAKRKKQKISDSSENESDTECHFCTESYSEDNEGEVWIRCVMCLKWGHEACAGVDNVDEGNFTCDICLSGKQFVSVKKFLRL
ncbi:hypothetical protein WA026_021545 [Henosepilachna vigintioctopunctata]|uniref:Zinc finger PHD-type domain-containing protein n=1 Tax=Henosepilachna vigintioctopunctata TaxID=420089 RepID=A0AAW1VD35_9CUCU